MLCEKCHHEVQPVVFVDIDGTLADYHTHLQNFCIDYYDLGDDAFDMTGCQWDGGGNFEDYLGISQEEYREAKLAFRQGGLKRTMFPYPHATHVVQQLNDMGLAVWITTTRPWQRLDNVDPDTREWLRRHGIEFDGLLYDEDKYGRALEIIDPERVVAVIDDLPEMVMRANDLGLAAFQVHRPHNSHRSQRMVPGGRLVDAVTWIQERIANAT